MIAESNRHVLRKRVSVKVRGASHPVLGRYLFWEVAKIWVNFVSICFCFVVFKPFDLLRLSQGYLMWDRGDVDLDVSVLFIEVLEHSDYSGNYAEVNIPR